MEAFYKAVGLGMVRRREMCFYAPGVKELLPKRRGELAPIVAGNRFGYSEGGYEAMRKCVDYRGRGDVDHRDCERPTSESIDCGQEVSKTI